jgi:hypothetical protein
MTGGETRQHARTAGRRGRIRGGWAWAAGTAAAAAVLMFCYLRIAGATQVNSDGAGLVLEAHNILQGNLLLHGWWATDVSFYTTEVPQYVAVTAVAGLRPEVVHICSAMTYTSLLLLAAWVARGRARGAEGVVRALLAGGVVLAPQPTGPTQVLLGSPDHVGSAVPVLLLLLLLIWARPRWFVPVIAAALLAWAITGDPLIEVVGAAPVFVACLIRAARLVWPGQSPVPGPAGSPAPRPAWSLRWAWSAAWYELSLAAAAAASVLLARAVSQLLLDLGGIRTAKAFYHLLPAHEIAGGLKLAAESVLALFGADYLGARGAGNIAFALVHLAGVALVLAATVLAGWRLVWPGARLRPWRGGGAADGEQPGDLITDILVLAMAANFTAFLIEVPIENIYSAHEIGPILSLGAALTGRVLGGPVLAAWRRARGDGAGRANAGWPAARRPDGNRAAPSRDRRAWPGRVLLPALAVVLAGYSVMLGIGAAHQQALPRSVGLARWLERHHLHNGLAPYWEAASTTVDSGGKIMVLSVAPDGWHGHLAPQKWQTDVQLAESKGRSANFVVVSPAENVHRKTVLDAFGPPADSYRWGPYTIYVWHKNLLPQLEQWARSPRTQTVSVPPSPAAADWSN